VGDPPASTPPVQVAERVAPIRAWRHALEVLSPYGRNIVDEYAGFVEYVDGELRLSVRDERAASTVRERLRDVDFSSHLPGFRRYEVGVRSVGRTGRELRAEHEERRRLEATAAAHKHPGLARLLVLLGGEIERVEALQLPGETLMIEEERSDD
jgi:hypothetical protein